MGTLCILCHSYVYRKRNRIYRIGETVTCLETKKEAFLLLCFGIRKSLLNICDTCLNICDTCLNIWNRIVWKREHITPNKFFALMRLRIDDFTIPVFNQKKNSNTHRFTNFSSMNRMYIFQLFRLKVHSSFFKCLTNSPLSKCFTLFDMSSNKSIPMIHIARIVPQIEENLISFFKYNLYFRNICISHIFTLIKTV
jgi:hypothetical protein